MNFVLENMIIRMSLAQLILTYFIIIVCIILAYKFTEIAFRHWKNDSQSTKSRKNGQ